MSADSLNRDESSAPDANTNTQQSRPSIGVNTVSDRVATEDQLGFDPYVLALAMFLKSPRTKPPLTVSIEGEWGSGKSSFMEQLARKLGEDTTSSNRKWGWRVTQPVIVRFNAWRHDKDEELWASFALAFTRQIRCKCSVFTRCFAPIELFLRRFNWSEGWLDAVFALCLWSALVLLAIAIPFLAFYHGPAWAENLSNQLANAGVASASHKGPSGATTDTGKDSTSSFAPAALTHLVFGGGGAASVALSLLIWFQARKLVGNPLEIKLRRYLSKPDYEGRMSFIDTFHSDFKKVINAYARGRDKVYVLIDDLDRCAVPKAAELMGAINLLISDDERLIFVVGMDRKTVAAGIAVKYESLLPYLSPYLSDVAPTGTAIRRDLDFGYAFLEKFIQLPFAVPTAGRNQLTSFLKSLSRADEPAQGGRFRTVWNSLAGYVRRSQKSDPAKTGDTTLDSPPPGAAASADYRESNTGATSEQAIRRESFMLLLEGDDSLIADVAIMAAPALDANPRRLKQFINLFRLKFYIAMQTGLLDSIDGKRKLTPQQLGKITAVFLRWPGFIDAWSAHPSLLARLYAFATSLDPAKVPLQPHEQRWSEHAELMGLLRHRCVHDATSGSEPDLEVFGLDHVECVEILQISPARPNPVDHETAKRTEPGDTKDNVDPIEVRRTARDQLDQYAIEYEEVRRTQNWSDARTAKMDSIVLCIRNAAPKASLTQQEIAERFNGGDGQRVVVLGCLQAAPSLQAVPILLEAISHSHSWFEQYHAMLAVDQVKEKLDHNSTLEFTKILRDQLPKLEKENDASRLRRLRDLLVFFDEQLKYSRDRANERRSTAKPRKSSKLPKKKK